MAINKAEYIPGAALSGIYKQQYGEELIYNLFGDSKMIDFLKKGVQMKYFELSHIPPNDFRIYLKSKLRSREPKTSSSYKETQQRKSFSFIGGHERPNKYVDNRLPKRDNIMNYRQGQRSNEYDFPKREVTPVNRHFYHPSESLDYRNHRRDDVRSFRPIQRSKEYYESPKRKFSSFNSDSFSRESEFRPIRSRDYDNHLPKRRSHNITPPWRI